MKKFLAIFVLVLCSVGAMAATDTPTNTPTSTPTWTPSPVVVPPSSSQLDSVFISPSDFMDSTGAVSVSSTGATISLTGTASAWPSCAPCALMTNSLGISFTAMIQVPTDINPDTYANGKLYAIVSQSAANNAGLRATFNTSDVPNTLSYTTSVAVSRYGIEGTVVGAIAAVKPVFVELKSNTSTSTAPIKFKPGQMVSFTVQRSSGATGNLAIRGLVFQYQRKTGYGR